VVIAFVLVFAVGLIAIGPWNDPEHPASVAVLMILLAGVLATVAILLIPESVWPP
jgi:hypothetical protein